MQSVIYNGYAGWFLESGHLENSNTIAITDWTAPATAFSFSGDQATLQAMFNPTSSAQTVNVTTVDGGISLTGLGFGAFYQNGSSGTQYYQNLDF